MQKTHMGETVTILRQNRLALLGFISLIALIVLAIATPLLPLPDPDATALEQSLRSPLSPGSPFGTDLLGRDLLSRILWGLRISLSMGLTATVIAAIAGSFIGLVTGFFGGWLDLILMRVIDALMAFPYLLLALLIVAVLGPGLFNALLAIAIVNIPFFARTVRGAVLGLVHRPFVDGARLSGESEWQIAIAEILPNVMPLIVITTASTVGWMILETAGLSFLGLGVQPPQADLGSMLGEGRSVFIVAPHVATIPGLVMIVIVLSINFLGDGIRDALDPRLQNGQLIRPQAKTAITNEVLSASSTSEKNQHHSKALLSCEDLAIAFQQKQQRKLTVKGVSIEIQPGDCLGIVGESGSGKSVTALALTALVPTPPGIIESGHVEFKGTSLLPKSVTELQHIRGKRIAYIFQNPMTSLNPLLTIGEQVTETILTHQQTTKHKAKAITLDLFRQVELPSTPSDLKRFPHQLSGGQQQRVAIAIALANQPDLIIADEPTTALDVITQAKIVELLNKLKGERQISLLLISHDMGSVAQLCDRIVVMYAGEIVESGPKDKVLQHPAHPYTQMLLRCIPILGDHEHPLSAIPGEPPITADISYCAFASRCPYHQPVCSQGVIQLSKLSRDHKVRCLFPVQS